MHTWIHKPQEREGKFLFSGAFYVTDNVLSALNIGEIIAIYIDIQALVTETGGIDYFQVYVNEVGDTLYFIDQCDPEAMADESFPEEFNHCTLLFSHEY